MTDRLVLLHGFTQTGRSWRACTAALERTLAERGSGSDVLAPDAPGHGDAAALRLDVPAAADRAVALGGRACYVGYSMGGRTALAAACRHPDLVDALVLVSASPGLATDAERAARRAGDEALATRLETIGVTAFIDEWLAQPLFASLPPDAAGREERLANTVEGLASSLRLAGTGAQPSYWDALDALTMPVLVVAGELDAKYVAIARAMVERIGDRAELVVIDGAGHSVPAEAPDALAGALARWLTR